MASTSDERREVAATMRAISCMGVRDLTLGEVLNSILTFGAPRPTTEMAILDRLADLIDPMCRNASGCQDVFECSECRCKVELIAEVCNEYGEPFGVPLMPSWCPNCGAEVVE